MDRAEFLGDPDFSPIPVAQLIDKRYAPSGASRCIRESLAEQRTPPTVFGDLDTHATPHRTEAIREPDHTTHYSVVDAEGNAVSVTYTLNDTLGSRVTANGLGFLLNDEMDDFASKQRRAQRLRPHPGPG